MPREIEITVRCIGCKAKRVIGREESARLSAEMRVPMCDGCFMPMVAEKVSA